MTSNPVPLKGHFDAPAICTLVVIARSRARRCILQLVLRRILMKSVEKVVLTVLLVLLIVALGAIAFTRDWADSPRTLHVDAIHSTHKDQLVDTRALETAQQLAPLAVTHWEQDYAQEALRLADHSVDLAFSGALEDAKENPPAATAETLELTKRLQELQTLVTADSEPHSYNAAKKWKLQYPRRIPIAEPASTSLRKCRPRIIREDAMSSATASNTT